MFAPAATRALVLLLGLALGAAASGCAPRIGDSCSSATNCSVNGDRQCDLAEPRGACIVFDCQPDACPDDAVCVRFRPDEPRLSVVACMRRCGSDAECRTGDGYACVSPLDLDVGFAEVTDVRRPDARFCLAQP